MISCVRALVWVIQQEHLARMLKRVAQEAEHGQRPGGSPDCAVAGLFEQFGVIDRAAVEPRRRSGLEPTLRQA